MTDWERMAMGYWQAIHGESMEKKKICILMGSPRANGNTIKLVLPFIEKMESMGCSCVLIWLYNKKIEPCHACRICQQDWSVFGCPQQDDMQEIFENVLDCELLILATPIYSWYCTPPMKAALDRLVYGMNKYYGDEKGPSLWEGKSVALISSCGYKPERGADLWEEGIKRYCKHSKLHYVGILTKRHLNYQTEFMDDAKKEDVVAFAEEVYRSCWGK